MIEVARLTKRYGGKTVVDDVSFRIEPGKVTGFLGPNGAGKSTTMRMIVGLTRPSAGSATIDGQPFEALRSPLTEVGVLLDGRAFHPGRSARSHLLAVATTHGIPHRRVEEVIDVTGLESVARKRAGGFSLGMGQRLGIAAALLGDPRVLILDEPVNGLDPDGVIWVRELAKSLAAEGRTVFLSSHLMSEMALTADHVIVLGRGRVVADAPIAEMVARASGANVRLRSPRATELVGLIGSAGWTVAPADDGALLVSGATAAQIGDLAAGAAIPLHELSPVAGTLEDAYLALTRDDVEFRSGE